MNIPPPKTESFFHRGDLQSSLGLSFLMAVEGIGPAKATKIAESFRDISNLRRASKNQIMTLIGKSTDSLIDHCASEIPPVKLPDGVRAICKFDDEWPDSLQSLKSPPAIIYVIGTVPKIPCIAVVGTREPTDFGLRVVDKVVQKTALRGWGVVSGLALGIDTEAHEMALKYGATTWAILGGGVDVPTPEKNRDLANRIVASGGGLISEQIPGTEPSPHSLVARNRLQVAFSDIVLAAQAGIPSGTLHTVRFALEQKKRLVVPRPTGQYLGEAKSKGNIELTNPLGCDLAILKPISKNLKKFLSDRRPVADLVLYSNDLDAIWGSTNERV